MINIEETNPSLSSIGWRNHHHACQRKQQKLLKLYHCNIESISNSDNSSQHEWPYRITLHTRRILTISIKHYLIPYFLLKKTVEKSLSWTSRWSHTFCDCWKWKGSTTLTPSSEYCPDYWHWSLKKCWQMKLTNKWEKNWKEFTLWGKMRRAIGFSSSRAKTWLWKVCKCFLIIFSTKLHSFTEVRPWAFSFFHILFFWSPHVPIYPWQQA